MLLMSLLLIFDEFSTLLYITATEKTKKSDKVKSSIPLSYIGPRGREVYNTFVFDDDFMEMNFN